MVNQNGKSVVVRIPTEPQSEPNETSPLKSQRGRENNSDASSSASAVTSEQSAKQLIQSDDMKDRSKNVALKVIVDILLLCCGEFDKEAIKKFPIIDNLRSSSQKNHGNQLRHLRRNFH